MDKRAMWKWLILVVLIAAALATVLPLDQKIRLGLDLKGGTSFVVQIDEEAVAAEVRDKHPDFTDAQVQEQVLAQVGNAQSRAVEVIRNRVDNMGIAEPVIDPEKGNRIVVQLPGIGQDKREEAERSIQSAAFLSFRMVHPDNDKLIEDLFDKGLAPSNYVIVSRTVRGREESLFRREKSAPAMDAAQRKDLAKFHAPAGYDLMLEREKVAGEDVYRPYFVSHRLELTGDTLKNAGVDYRALGQPVVTLQFDGNGTRKFRRVTSDYAPGGAKNPSRGGTDRYMMMAIVMDDTLYSAPRINEPIPGGRAEISGSFSIAEATFLSNVLRAGALPAPVKIVEKRVVDPTLGRDSIDSGVKAGLYGCIAIIVLMGAYYLVAGLLADLALILNVVLLPLGMILVAGFLGVFSGEGRSAGAIALPVLTLPGIAGIALSIGMAVDANVLIFERMREELRTGKGLVGTIQAGFERAFTAILDSNMTTIITAIILFLLGSGPVRGYAVTLTAGLIVSLYTAVIVTRMCFNVIAARRTDTGVLRMMSVIKQTNFDFMKPWKVALAISLVVIVGSWGLMVAHGAKDRRSVFGVDFTGGSSLTLSFTKGQEPGVEDLRSTLGGVGIGDATIQYQAGMESGSAREFLQVKVGDQSEGAKVEKLLLEKFPGAGFKLMKQDDVGPLVGGELQRKAMWAMLASLVAMVIYIWIRFEFGFGLGAVAALFHDVLVTAGVMHLLGFQFNLTIVAALMTIVGYSVNDTIVIFDRIREDLRLVRNKSFTDICNQSMNETLARTLLTNFMTFVSVLFLLIMGGGAIKDFATAMFIGMISGTYSTIYIATPVVLMWYGFKTPQLGKKPTVA